MFANSRNSHVVQEIRVEEGMQYEVKSDFRPEVEMSQVRACALKYMQYNTYLWPNRRYIRVLYEIPTVNNKN